VAFAEAGIGTAAPEEACAVGCMELLGESAMRFGVNGLSELVLRSYGAMTEEYNSPQNRCTWGNCSWSSS